MDSLGLQCKMNSSELHVSVACALFQHDNPCCSTAAVRTDTTHFCLPQIKDCCSKCPGLSSNRAGLPTQWRHFHRPHLTKWHKGRRSTLCSNVTPAVLGQTLQGNGRYYSVAQHKHNHWKGKGKTKKKNEKEKQQFMPFSVLIKAGESPLQKKWKLTRCSSHFSTMCSTTPPRTEIFESSSSKRPFLISTVPSSLTLVPGGVFRLEIKNKQKER